MKLIGSVMFIATLMNSAYALHCNYFFEQRLFPILVSKQYKVVKLPQYNPENVKWLQRESFFTNEIVMQKEGNAFAIDQFVEKHSRKRGDARFISVTSRDSERLFGSDYEVFHQIRLPNDEVIAYSSRIDEETAMVVTVRDFNKVTVEKEVNFYVINKDGFDNYVAKMKYDDDFDKLKVGVADDGSFIVEGNSGLRYQLQLKSAAAKTAQE